MGSQSEAELIRDLRLRAEGIQNNLTLLADVGLKQTDADQGRAYATRIEQLNAEQEALKAALKLKTTEIATAQRESKAWRTRVTNLIKTSLAKMPEKWVEFGIKATK